MTKLFTKSRVFKTVLVVSLALNLLVIAAFAGASWRHGGPPGGPRANGHTKGLVGMYLSALPREDRRALRQELKQARQGTSRKAIHQEIRTALSADILDQEAIDQILAKERQTRVALQDRLQAMWLEKMSEMSQDEREAYLERIDARKGHKRQRSRD